MSVLLRGVLEKRSREGEWRPQTFEVRSDHKLSYYAGGGLSRTLDFADVLKIERKNTNTLILWMDGSSRHQLRRPEEAPATDAEEELEDDAETDAEGERPSWVRCFGEG